MKINRTLFGSAGLVFLLVVTVLVAQILVVNGAQARRLASCCLERVGDANGVGGDEPTIGDISVMIDAKFISGSPTPIACTGEADVNLSGGTDPQIGDVTIGDISVLIDYLFITGPSLGLSACAEPNPCLDCHGGVDNQSGAPPGGLRGETAVTTLAVGAHTRHLEGGSLSSGVACGECHIVPEGPDDIGHQEADSIAELTFGPLAGVAAVWDRNTETCGLVYCHGNFSGGHTTNAPVWTVAGEPACGSCHEVDRTAVLLGGRHAIHANAFMECYECHADVANGQKVIIDRDLHINGTVNVAFSSGVGSYAAGWCNNPGCHSSAPW